MNPIVMTPFDHARLHALLEQLAERDKIDPQSLEQLEDELARARIVDEDELPTDVVTMNTEVIVLDVDTGEEQRVRVVFPHMANVERGCISVLAPIGLAVLGCREGDELTWRTPRRKRRLRIHRVTYQPEAQGDRI